MIISHTHKFIFIKSLKTAGTSVESILSNYCSGDDIVTPLNDFSHNRNEKGEFIHRAMNAEDYREIGQHVDAATIRGRLPAELWNSYFKISLARNPWDRAVSFFYWEHRQDPAIRPQKRFYHHLGVPFSEPKMLQQQFRRFLESDKWGDNDRFYTADGKLCVDFVIRYEQLNDDFAEVCRKLGLPTQDLPRLKAGIRKQRHHYSEYYDEASRALVAERHRHDIELLGYRFETPERS
jgi:hypothetical protein